MYKVFGIPGLTSQEAFGRKAEWGCRSRLGAWVEIDSRNCPDSDIGVSFSRDVV